MADLDVSGVSLAIGVSDVAVQLPPQASTVVTTVQNLGPQLLGILCTGSVDYRVQGRGTFRGLGITLPNLLSGYLDPFDEELELASSASDSSPSRCIPPARQAIVSFGRLIMTDAFISTLDRDAYE